MEANNMAALREALESMRNLAFEVQDMNGEGDVKTSLPPKWVIDVVNFALSAPPRNCDVGTPVEQNRRFRRFCGGRCLAQCRVYKKGIELGIINEKNYYKADCRFVWGQMPYEEGGANERI